VTGLGLALFAFAGALRAEPEVVPADAGLVLAVDAPGGPADEQRRALDHGSTEAEDTAPGTLADRGGDAGGLRVTFGRAFTQNAADGWYGRLEVEGFATYRYEKAGPGFGVLIGGEYWRGEDGAGGGMPATFWVGGRTPVLFGSVGVGFETFIVDRVHDDTGFGLYVPLAEACLGIELSGFRLLADARALYRWQWGADDRAQYQVGISMSQFLERPAPRPSTRRRGVVDHRVRGRRSR
jgi:hypothetical protein